MTLYLSEAEMLDRYCDGLKKSASRAGEFLSVTNHEQRLKLFVDFIDGIKVAAGSSHQLAHSQENPKWLDTRDILENIITISQKITDYSDEQVGPIWLRIQQSLNDMIDTGRRLASSKSMLRNDVLDHLKTRSDNAHLLSDNG